MRALLIYPTHQNCLETVAPYLDAGISASAYPARVITSDNGYEVNCWNPVADSAEKIGFSVVKSVCPTCQMKTSCQRIGYLQQIQMANQADVLICTHKRTEHTGLRELSEGRDYVSIHENPVSLLRPSVEATLGDLNQVQVVLNRLLNDPHFLDWFGECLRRDDEGIFYEDQELAIRRERQLEFIRLLSEMIDQLVSAIYFTQGTMSWNSQIRRKSPEGIERTLFFATRVAAVAFAGQPWRFVLLAVAGELNSAAIIVTKQFRKGMGQNNYQVQKHVVGFRSNSPNLKSVTWFNDATTTADSLERVLGHPVQDRTPDGRIELQRKAVQLLRDITRRTSPSTFQSILRGVLSDRPQFQRIGVICHSIHLPAIKSLEPEFSKRITKVAYFGSGEDRSSNDWYEQCDLLIVAGTPRLPPSAIATYLVQVRNDAAACVEPPWKAIHWVGRTESGETVHVHTKGYQDETWRRAHRELVRAALVQAIGRGCGILEVGCEVIVLSNEECGLVISDSTLESLNASAVKVLSVLDRLTMENPNRYILGKTIVSTSEIASQTDLSLVRVRELLRHLERRGRVTKVGERGGWHLVSLEGSAQLSSVDAETLVDSDRHHESMARVNDSG